MEFNRLKTPGCSGIQGEGAIINLGGYGSGKGREGESERTVTKQFGNYGGREGMENKDAWGRSRNRIVEKTSR